MKEKEKEKGKRLVDDLLKELEVLEKKKAKILQEAEELTRRQKVNPQEVRTLVKRLQKLLSDFQDKLEEIEKMAARL